MVFVVKIYEAKNSIGDIRKYFEVYVLVERDSETDSYYYSVYGVRSFALGFLETRDLLIGTHTLEEAFHYIDFLKVYNVEDSDG